MKANRYNTDPEFAELDELLTDEELKKGLEEAEEIEEFQDVSERAWKSFKKNHDFGFWTTVGIFVGVVAFLVWLTIEIFTK